MAEHSPDKDGVDNRTPAKVAAQLQQDMFAHPQAGKIPVQASTVMLAIQELRRLQEACDKHSESDLLLETTRSHVAPIDTDRMRAAMACEYSSCVNHDMSKSRCDHCPLEALPSTTPLKTAHEELSEVVSDTIDHTVGVPIMRCSPCLPDYIKALEDACDLKRDEHGVHMGNVRLLREEIAALEASAASAIEQKPWAWCKSDVNGRPTDILQGAEAQAAKEAGYILTPLYRGASPKDADRLREIEHMVWHVLDESEEDASTGNISIRPSDDYFKLCELLPEGHPEENNSPDGGKQTDG